MSSADIAKLQAAIQRVWPGKPSAKAQRYIGRFFDGSRMKRKIRAKVVGNHGTYTVSIEAKGGELLSACSCYIGRDGFCHHCQALAFTFLREPTHFRTVTPKRREDIHSSSDIGQYLQSVTLDDLLKQLGEKGITQKAFAESIGMNPRHLSAIKSSEARHHYFNELGATKLACLWVLEQMEDFRKDGE